MKRGIAWLVWLMASSSCSADGQPGDADAREAQSDASIIDAAPSGIDAMPRLDAFWTAIPADELGARLDVGLAFDAVTQRLILLGGCRFVSDVSCLAVNDVWVLDLSGGLAQARWTELSPAGESPVSTPAGFKVSNDPASGRLLTVVVGVEELELWALEDANGVGAPRWIRLATTGTEAPSLRNYAVFGHDPDRDLLYMFGGLLPEEDSALGDMWMLENASGVDGAPRWQALPHAPETLVEVVLPVDDAAPLEWGVGRSSLYDPASDRLFFFGVGDQAGNPSTCCGFFPTRR